MVVRKGAVVTLRIGRALMTDTDVSAMSHDGDLLSLSFNIMPSTLAEAKVRRQQILGLIDNDDEPVVPVTWDQDAEINGYYRPLSATVEPTEAYLTNRLMRANVALSRVANGYANPFVETYVVQRIATNSHGVTTSATALVAAVLSDAELIDFKTDGISSVEGDAVIAVADLDGNNTDSVKAFYGDDAQGYSLAYIDPSSYYSVGDCAIYDGTTDLPVMGRQVSQLTSDNWVMSNGHIQISPSGTDNQLTFKQYDNPWRTKTLRAGRIVSGSFTTYAAWGITGGSTPVILRNSPETVSIRVANGLSQPDFTFTLHRGSATLFITVDTPDSDTVAIGLEPNETGTAVTGGARTGNDVNGNRFGIFNRAAVTVSTTHCAVARSSAATQSVFGVGFIFGGALADPPWSPTAHLETLCSPPQWQQRIVAR